jgi:hypothetical protein
VIALPLLVLPFAEIVIAPSAAAMLGVVSGSALANEIVAELNDSLAIAATVADTVTLAVVVVAARSVCAATRAKTAVPSNKNLMGFTSVR